MLLSLRKNGLNSLFTEVTGPSRDQKEPFSWQFGWRWCILRHQALRPCSAALEGFSGLWPETMEKKGKISVTFLAGHGEMCPATWVIHMATRRPAHNTPIHMELVPFCREPYRKSMWIGVLWAGLRVAMWITHVGGQISPWPARKVTENIGFALPQQNRGKKCWKIGENASKPYF